MPPIDKPIPVRAAPKPAPKPVPTSTATGNNPRGTAIAPAPKPTVNDRRVVAQTIARAKAGTPRGTTIPTQPLPQTINDVKAEHPDPQSVLKVFHAQSKTQQKAVVQGALKDPSSPVSKIILGYLQAYPGQASQYATTPSINFGGILKALSPSNVYGSNSKGSTQGGGELAGAVMFGGPSGAKQIVGNAGKDVINLPAQAFTTAATLGGDVAGGHAGKALSDVASPFVQLATHPAQMFYQHPVDTALMASGVAGGLSRAVAAPLRASVAEDSLLGRALSTKREGVKITGNLTHERPAYSKSPTIKAGQVAVEKALYKRAPTGELIHRQNPVGEFVRTRHINQHVAELRGVQERVRRVNRQAATEQRMRDIRPSRPARALHTAKSSLKYGPDVATIPGAHVFARVADATVRRADTFAQDLRAHANSVEHAMGDLSGKKLKAAQQYVKLIRQEADKGYTAKQLEPLFKAAESYRKDYGLLEGKALSFGHYGADMTAGGLERRALEHYASTHMGAKVNSFFGVMRPGTKEEVRAFRTNVAMGANRLESEGGAAKVARANAMRAAGKEAWDRQMVPMKTSEIIAHLKSENGTGGRMPAYTPDRARLRQDKAEGRSAFYVSQERRPLPTTKRNLLYNYEHGLTNPGHTSALEQHVLMQGIVDSHVAYNQMLDTVTHQLPGGGYAKTFSEAEHAAPAGYRPINLAQSFHPQGSLDMAMREVNPAAIEHEAVRRSLDLEARTQPTDATGRWGLVDEKVLKALKAHENQIQPNAALRTFRGLNNQFRTVALSTSFRHVPGVIQENLIRDLAHGVGFRSWVTGHRVLKQMAKESPEEAGRARTALAGGQVAGMTEAAKTYTVSQHWEGTSAYPVLRAFEAMAKAPGLRQMRTLWRSWTHFAINGTKHLLEEQHQIAGLGKTVLREHGYAEAAKIDGIMGLFQRALGLHGRMLEDAANGLFDPAKLRQMRASINQIYGKWTDLSPVAQTTMMFSPFGLWWLNSAKFLARMPVDQPVKTGVLAAATAGTEQERKQQGLDLFAPNALPSYEQGGVPLGGKIIAQNYYSPFGTANEPLATAGDLILPWFGQPVATAKWGVNWLGKPLTAPGQNTTRFNEKEPNSGQILQYILDSAASSFIPFYTKASQIAAGGGKAYDVSPGGIIPPLLRGKQPAMEKPGKGPTAGLLKVVQPWRSYKKYTPKTTGGGGTVIPGGGSSLGGVVIPGEGSTSGVVIP